MLTCDDLMLLGPLSDPGMKVVQTRWERKQSCVDMCKEDKANLLEADGNWLKEYITGDSVNEAIGKKRKERELSFKQDLASELRLLCVTKRYHGILEQAIANMCLSGHKHSKRNLECEIRILRDKDRDHVIDMVTSCPLHDFDVKVKPLKRKGDRRLLTGVFNEWHRHALEQRQEQERQAALQLAENTAENAIVDVDRDLCIFNYVDVMAPDLARRKKRRIEQEEKDRQTELALEKLEKRRIEQEEKDRQTELALEKLEKIRHDAEKDTERMLKETQEREAEEQKQRTADAAAAEALARERTQRLYTTEVLALMCDGPRERTQRLSMNYGAASGTANSTIDRVAMVDSENTTRDTLGKNPHFAPFGGYANNRDGRWSPDV
jgi:hypothetical protein